MEDFIKIPRDFQSLHDLGDLVSNFEVTNRLMVALNNYQMAYVNSMLLTGDELLKAIPKRDHSKFKFMCRNDKFEHITSVTINEPSDGSGTCIRAYKQTTEIDKLIKRHSRKTIGLATISKNVYGYNKYDIDGKSIADYLNTEVNTLTRKIVRINKIGDNKNIKMYLPDFVNKTIRVCYWVEGATLNDEKVLKKLDDNIKKAEAAYENKLNSTAYNYCDTERYAIIDAKNTKEYSVNNIPSPGDGNLEYDKSNLIFDVDILNNTLSVIIPFTFVDSYTVGGVWINGRANGYLSGGTSTPYTRTGKDIYTFCTRTNKFIGFNEQLGESRGWVKGGW